MAEEQVRTGFDAAFDEALKAGERGEVPIGAAILHKGRIIASAGNRTREDADPTAHAEILAIRAACAALGSERIDEADLYVTLEPCPMCASAISFARIRRLYYAASDAKSGGVEQGPRIFDHATCHHKPEIYAGLREREAANMLTEFFGKLRRE